MTLHPVLAYTARASSYFRGIATAPLGSEGNLDAIFRIAQCDLS